MKKFFVILLSIILTFEQSNVIKVNAEPTELCRRLINFLEEPRLDERNERFSLEQLRAEIENYNENDFPEDERKSINHDIEAYQKAINVLMESLQREIPDEIDRYILINKEDGNDRLENEPELARDQANAIYNYLFKDIDPRVVVITSDIGEFHCKDPEVKSFMYSEEFRRGNEEVLIRYISLVHKYEDEELVNHVAEALIFSARILLHGYTGVTMFSVYRDDVDVVHADSFIFFNSEDQLVSHLDEFFIAL